jgi:general stress protein CsbA
MGGLLLAISGYYISEYWWLFVVILSMVIGGYYIDGY